MDKPRVGPPFNAARDAQAAWRIAQVNLLTEAQHSRYDSILEQEKARQEARRKELQKQRAQQIMDEKRRQLLEHQKFVYTLFPLRRIGERRAERLAADIVDKKAALDIATLIRDGQKRVNDYLRACEKERAHDKLKQDFNQNAQEKLKHAFERRARQTGMTKGKDRDQYGRKR